MKKPKLTVVVGPTASGKTDFAIQQAQKNAGAVISADSRQVYTRMDVGTAKPLDTRYSILDTRDQAHDILMPDVIEGVPHYLLNIRVPDNPMTLSEWQAAAFQAIDHVIEQGQSPILVGGTMLYVDSVVFNYQIPMVAPNQKLRARLEALPETELWQQLVQKDPPATKFIEPHHKQRIIRALEVIEATGKPFSEQRKKREPRYETELFGLFPGWAELEARIQKRVEQMFVQGLLEETQHLLARYGKNLPLLKTMNYKQAALVLAGEMDEGEAIKEMVRANMRYARRQMSWWRGRKEIVWR